VAKDIPYSVRFDDAEREAIEAEQARLKKQGLRVSKSQAIRSLIMRGSTVTDCAADGRTLAGA
jgi:hypothetical protein